MRAMTTTNLDNQSDRVEQYIELHPRYVSAHSDLFDRRRVIRLLVGCAATVGFTMLGMFRNVRRASAYTEYGAGSQNSFCGSYDPDTWYGGTTQNGYHDPAGCQDGACVGASQAEMGRYLCVKCAEVSGSNPNQWHFVGSRTGGYTYGDHTNVCSPQSPARDAWRWKQSACGFCAPATWRCHDGWKRDPDGTFHSLTICQGLVYCNGTFYTGCN